MTMENQKDEVALSISSREKRKQSSLSMVLGASQQKIGGLQEGSPLPGRPRQLGLQHNPSTRPYYFVTTLLYDKKRTTHMIRLNNQKNKNSCSNPQPAEKGQSLAFRRVSALPRLQKFYFRRLDGRQPKPKQSPWVKIFEAIRSQKDVRQNRSQQCRKTLGEVAWAR